MNSYYNSKLTSGVPRYCFLTIAIPTYNQPEKLKKAINSVVSQNSFELCQLLIVDNDSRDCETPTSKMMGQYADQENIIYYRNKENVGMYANWNRCFELAECDYLLLLHTDDFLLPGCIQYVLDVLKDQHIKTLYLNRGHVGIHDRKTAVDLWNKKRLFLNRMFRKRIVEHKAVLKDTLLGLCLTAPTGFIMRKKLFLNNHRFKLEAPQWPSDAEFQLKLIKEGIAYMSEERCYVKVEDGENAGGNKEITIPLIASHKLLYFDIYKNEKYLFKSLLIYVRLRLIAEGFQVANEPEVRAVIPKFYFSWLSSIIYGILKRFGQISFILR